MKASYETALNSSFCAVTADWKSGWPCGRKAYFRGVWYPQIPELLQLHLFVPSCAPVRPISFLFKAIQDRTSRFHAATHHVHLQSHVPFTWTCPCGGTASYGPEANLRAAAAGSQGARMCWRGRWWVKQWIVEISKLFQATFKNFPLPGSTSTFSQPFQTEIYKWGNENW